MNERIRELAEQAGWDMGDEVCGFTTRLEKFSNLLVRECSQYVEDEFDFCGDELIIAEKLLNHFGVER